MMKLWEQGKFGFDDPLSKHLPEYADVKVYDGKDASGAPVGGECADSEKSYEACTDCHSVEVAEGLVGSAKASIVDDVRCAEGDTLPGGQRCDGSTSGVEPLPRPQYDNCEPRSP